MCKMHMFWDRQLTYHENNQAEEYTQYQQEHECSISDYNTEHDIVVEDYNRQQTEEHRAQHEQQDGHYLSANALVLKLAQHTQWANVRRLYDRPQTEDQRGYTADHHTTEKHARIEHKGHIGADVLHHVAYEVTHAYRGSRADYATDQPEQSRFQAEEQVEILAMIARRLEHSNLCFAA